VIGAVAKMLEAHHDTTTNSNYIQIAPAEAAAAMQKLVSRFRSWATNGRRKRLPLVIPVAVN
jgi:hypothetical protein